MKLWRNLVWPHQSLQVVPAKLTCVMNLQYWSCFEATTYVLFQFCWCALKIWSYLVWWFNWMTFRPAILTFKKIYKSKVFPWRHLMPQEVMTLLLSLPRVEGEYAPLYRAMTFLTFASYWSYKYPRDQCDDIVDQCDDVIDQCDDVIDRHGYLLYNKVF